MKKIEIETAGDFCKDCVYCEIDETKFYLFDARPMRTYQCKHKRICDNAIELFAKAKGLKEDDWMEDQI